MNLPETPVILLVDDEPLIRRSAADILTDCGCEVLEAGNADEALRILHDRPDITLVFTDANMPGTINGLRLLERVHALRPTVELILTSGRAHFAKSALPDDGTFLPKPYDAFKLCDLVADKLDGRPAAS